jgi:hypothetical protein
MWLDPRVTGSLCDLLIECNDLYYKAYGKKNGLKKGWRLAWDIMDQSGKMTGKQFNPIGSTTFNARFMWNTYNTENFVDPREARKKLRAEQKMVTDEFGNEVPLSQWLSHVHENVLKLAKTQAEWDARDLWNALGIEDMGLRMRAGRYLRGSLGIEKIKDNCGYSRYDLSDIGS